MTSTPATNIDGRQKTFRLLNGVILTLLGLFLVYHMDRSDQPWWFAFLLFPIFLGAALGFFQAQASVCVLHASRGTCHIGGQAQAVKDDGLRQLLGLKGRSIARRAFWIAVLVTVASALLLRSR